MYHLFGCSSNRSNSRRRRSSSCSRSTSSSSIGSRSHSNSSLRQSIMHCVIGLVVVVVLAAPSSSNQKLQMCITLLWQRGLRPTLGRMLSMETMVAQMKERYNDIWKRKSSDNEELYTDLNDWLGIVYPLCRCCCEA